MPRVSRDKADWNDVIISQGKSRTVWHSPETRRGQESSPAGSSGAIVTHWFQTWQPDYSGMYCCWHSYTVWNALL